MQRISSALFAVMMGLLCAAVCGAVTPDPSKFKWTEEHAGTPLNSDGFVLTFSDDFDKQSVTSVKGKGVWLAPVHSPYGKAVFDTPGPNNSTYSIQDGILTIRASKDSKGKWHGGNIQTVDAEGKGFGQRLGYFETRIKFPLMPGAWCAFWLKTQNESTDPSLIKAELDAIEWYGGDPRGHHHSVHLRPNRNTAGLGGITQHWWQSNYSGIDGLGGEWHTHGVLIDQDLIVIYLDRKEVARFPALDEFKAPLYPLISMTLHDADFAKAVSPFDMQVDYVRVYSLPTTPLPPRLIDSE
jgi:beta-glucanase (GH16 family)